MLGHMVSGRPEAEMNQCMSSRRATNGPTATAVIVADRAMAELFDVVVPCWLVVDVVIVSGVSFDIDTVLSSEPVAEPAQQQIIYVWEYTAVNHRCI